MDDEYYFSAYTNNRCENDDGVVVVVIHNNQIGGRGTTKTMSNLTNLDLDESSDYGGGNGGGS